jgi:hypothetical protein
MFAEVKQLTPIELQEHLPGYLAGALASIMDNFAAGQPVKWPTFSAQTQT